MSARPRLLVPLLVGLCLFTRNGATGQVTFVDVTAESQLDLSNHAQEEGWFGAGAAVGDYDGDGDLDVYVIDIFGWPSRLYRNDGNKTFTDVTEQAGVGHLGSSRMALFLDLDNDGDQDLVLGNEGTGAPPSTTAQLYRNDGGTFTNVTVGSGLLPRGVILGGMSATDYDGDGRVDLYFTYWANLRGEPYNFLYHNDGNFHFTDVTQSMGLLLFNTQVRTWSPVFIDVNADGYQDLFSAVDFDHNYLFLYDPNSQTFVDVSIEANVLHEGKNTTGNDMGLAVGDCDGDGDLDIFTTNITLPIEGGGRTNALFINHMPDPFTDEAVTRGVWQSYWGWGTDFLDVDLDGDLDLVSVGGRNGSSWGDKPGQLFLNDGTGFYEDIGPEAGADHLADSRTEIAFDYDGDGDEDLLITDVDQPGVLLENVTIHTNHYLVVRLVGTVRTRDAIGAKIRLTANGHTQFHEMHAGASFFAALPWDQHFGVGAATSVDEIVVDWPGGALTLLVDVPVDQVITIVEGQSPSGGDWDSDGLVDLDDYAQLAQCLLGSGAGVRTPSPTCEAAFDFNRDADVDLEDVRAFQNLVAIPGA